MSKVRTSAATIRILWRDLMKDENAALYELVKEGKYGQEL